MAMGAFFCSEHFGHGCQQPLWTAVNGIDQSLDDELGKRRGVLFEQTPLRVGVGRKSLRLVQPPTVSKLRILLRSM